MKNNRLFALGFRPFYSLAGILAVVSVLFWLLAFTGVFHAEGHLQGVLWHSHEMVFGFAVAVICGFLLTAVRNWTGRPTPTGTALAMLVAVWFAGRVLIFIGPVAPAAIVDVAFVPLLAFVVAVPISNSRNRRNYKIVALLAGIAILHTAYHLAGQGPIPAWFNRASVIATIDLITILLAIVAGRVIPAFTRNAIPEADPKNEKWLEALSFGSLSLIIAVTLSNGWAPVPVLIPTTLLVVAAVSHSFRLAFWEPQKTLGNPLLWMMPLAYSWLPVALFLRALAQYSIVGEAAWIHALTTGGISGFMLAMMMRSSLGHTGRSLAANGMDMSAFLLLQLAAIVRVAAALFPSGAYRPLVIVSGVLWVLAFLTFLLRYLPMLVQPRADGRPG